MPLSENIQTPWIDIVDLPVPVESLSLSTILIALLIIVCLIVLLRFIWRQPRFVALRQLRRLEQTTTSSRQQLFLIRKNLQHGLQVNHLKTLSFDATQLPAWQHYCDELVRACYQPVEPLPQDIQRFAADARDWIKRAK